MNATTSKAGSKASGKDADAIVRSATGTGAITPAAALARHIEWLDFALAAARSEEAWRAARQDEYPWRKLRLSHSVR